MKLYGHHLRKLFDKTLQPLLNETFQDTFQMKLFKKNL